MRLRSGDTLRMLVLVVLWTIGSAAHEPRRSPRGAVGTTFYVRLDGGTPDQCTGRTDAPYPGSGSSRDCAWDHPFRALPPGGSPRISGGDTLIIAAGGYPMGFGAPGAGSCDPDAPWDCHMPPVPSGPDPADPTRILGAGWDSGCPNPPELWGRERPRRILDLDGSSNVEVRCLMITDHSACVEFHADPALACDRDAAPYGDWAPIGVYAADSADIELGDIDIHGLAGTGVHAGRLTDWTLEDVRIAGNGWAGWDGDLWDGADANSGSLTFNRVTIEWNGCGETYPGGAPTGCWGQTAGGYGDGLGTGTTGGSWSFVDCTISHNTSDGLDLLYHSEGGTISIDRLRAEGNAGNQVKVTGQTTVTNSVLVGNCGFFDGQPFTHDVDTCRALGNTLEVSFMGGEDVSVVSSTIYGQGDGLVGAGPRSAAGGVCDGSETVGARNTVFHGDTELLAPGDITFLFYQEGCADLVLDSDFNIAWTVKNLTCGGSGTFVDSGAHDLCVDPLLVGPLDGELYGMHPTPDSPAVDSGDGDACPDVDILGTPRPCDGDGDGDAECDRGAYELPPDGPAPDVLAAEIFDLDGTLAADVGLDAPFLSPECDADGDGVIGAADVAHALR